MCNAAKLECVKNITETVDISTCDKECAGMMITSYYFDQFHNDLNNVFPKMMDDYGIYKKVTKYPTNYEGSANVYYS